MGKRSKGKPTKAPKPGERYKCGKLKVPNNPNIVKPSDWAA